MKAFIAHIKASRQSTLEEGQGLVEYALILVLVAVVSILILTVLGRAIGNVFSSVTCSFEKGAEACGMVNACEFYDAQAICFATNQIKFTASTTKCGSATVRIVVTVPSQTAQSATMSVSTSGNVSTFQAIAPQTIPTFDAICNGATPAVSSVSVRLESTQSGSSNTYVTNLPVVSP